MHLHNDLLAIEVAERGAELRSIRTPDGAEWLWQGDPAWWGGRSPLLFPVVGRSREGSVSIAGTEYPMDSHGFARAQDFVVEGSGTDWVTLALGDNEATRRSYPFAFRLALTYRLEGRAVMAEAVLINRDDTVMPAQFGFHPGFNWPLPGAGDRRHTLSMANAGPAPCCRLSDDKLLARASEPSPFVDGAFEPRPEMFANDAMIFVGVEPRRIVFAADGGPSLEMTTSNLPDLGIWTKPGAPFLCIEPWYGTAPFVDRAERLEERNGVALLAPGETRAFSMCIAISPTLSVK